MYSNGACRTQNKIVSYSTPTGYSRVNKWSIQCIQTTKIAKDNNTDTICSFFRRVRTKTYTCTIMDELMKSLAMESLHIKIFITVLLIFPMKNKVTVKEHTYICYNLYVYKLYAEVPVETIKLSYIYILALGPRIFFRFQRIPHAVWCSFTSIHAEYQALSMNKISRRRHGSRDRESEKD